MQLRSFDVPLMAFLMGMSFYMSKKDKIIEYGSYVRKRLKRLVGPTWQFLTLFFIIVIPVAFLIFGKDQPFDWQIILSSYLLLDGIGYVWIIGVFVVVALLNPFILRFSKGVKENRKYFSIIGVIYIGYIGLTLLNRYLSGTPALLFEHLVLYTIGYGLIAAVGIRFKQLSKREVWSGFIVSVLVYFVLAYSNGFALTSIAKYPPTTYYLSYAMVATFGLSLLLEVKPIFNIFNNKFVYFISENSMWFYLWHIFPVYSMSIVERFIPILETSWVLRFVYVFIVTIILTLVHSWVMDKLEESKLSKTEALTN